MAKPERDRVVGSIAYSVSTWRQPVPSVTEAARVAVLERVADRVESFGRRRRRVGIDGFTAAGKTSFGHELAECLARRGVDVLRASLDDFKRPWAERHQYDRVSGEGYYRNAFDLAAIDRLLVRPSSGDGSGQVALCSIDPLTQVDHSSIRTTMASDAVLVVDGVFALRPELRHAWNVGVWLDVDEELSVARGVRRDAAMEGDAANAERLHRDRYLAAERIHLAEADPRAFADFVIDNTDFARPSIVSGSPE